MKKKEINKNVEHKKLKKVLKISLISLGGICGALFLAWGGINVFKFAVYKDFNSVTQKNTYIPGINGGAVMQGITVYNKDYYITSNYMADEKRPSRLYVVNKKTSKSRYIELYEDNEFTKPCLSHCGGVQFDRKLNKLYIAGEKRKILEVDIVKVMNENINKIALTNTWDVDNQASSIFTDENNIYVSEFNRDKTAWTSNHEITYNNQTHKAIISVFKNDTKQDFSKPITYYSIPDNVQGVAFRNGVLYTSTSWSIASSHLISYDLSKVTKIDDYKTGIPTYFVSDNAKIKDLKCPPMLEDLDFDEYNENRLITYNESASNKYLFGKLFFANRIYAIKVD